VGDLLEGPNRLLVVFDERLGDGDAHRQHLFGADESGMHLPRGDEGADHEAGRDEEHDGQCDLGDDERVPGAMPLASGARRASALFQRRHNGGRWPVDRGSARES
jgi:hypothetical protein